MRQVYVNLYIMYFYYVYRVVLLLLLWVCCCIISGILISGLKNQRFKMKGLQKIRRRFVSLELYSDHKNYDDEN